MCIVSDVAFSVLLKYIRGAFEQAHSNRSRLLSATGYFFYSQHLKPELTGSHDPHTSSEIE
jgi:hypothetical protein